MKRLFYFALLALFTMPVAAATVQQDFDAAQAKLAAQDFSGAREAFTALLARFPPDSKGKAASLVRARLANALIATNDPDAAVPLLDAALPGLPAGTPAEAELRASALFDLGRAQEALGLLDAAAAQYRAALATKAYPADGAIDIAMRASLARTLIWAKPQEARALLDGLLALPTAQLDGAARGLVLTLRGRVDLNHGQPADAKAWFAKASAAVGGSTTTKVSVADIRIRSDQALASFALGDTDSVAKYLTYAGATGDVGLFVANVVESPLPACAPVTGLAPDASAIIEFGIGDDGRVASATPIYATRGSGPALAPDEGPEVLFTRAVRDWYWRPADMRKLDGFWRQAVRVQVRCFTRRPGSGSIEARYQDAFTAWYQSLAVAPLPAPDDNDAKALAALKAELARREQAAGPASPQLLPVLTALSSNGAATFEEQEAAAQRWTAIAAPLSPPAEVMLVVQLSTVERREGMPRRNASNSGKRQRLEALLAEAEAKGAGDTRIAMQIRLSLAQVYIASRRSESGRELLRRIGDAPQTVLPFGDPVRQQALLEWADEASRVGDRATAEQTLAATGLAPEQCALIDVKPQGINNQLTASTIPNLAMRWGTSGMVRLGFDITTEGRPAQIRTIVASPPFIFNEAMEKAVTSFRYRPVFRPGNSVGCSGYTQSVRLQVLG